VTVVYVTHDQTEALTMSDRVAVFNDGVIQQLSDAKELYDKPANSFVAQFIGENNKLSGEITAVKGDGCTVKLDSGEMIKATKVVAGGVGTRTTLSIRPERIELNPASKIDNVVDATVKELVFLGDHMRLRMAAAGLDDFVVKVPHKSSEHLIAEGKNTKIGWQAQDCRALD
jgi:putative spermidine/putrescine transport system ATP-binding protein